jgi:predicted TIM-barrel fold metal-dependent hydrolase
MRAIDFHTHAFPDALAPVAIPKLLASCRDEQLRAHHDGTIAGLERVMDTAGISAAVVASIATKPSQNRSILEWCLSLREGETRRGGGPRFYPFPSVHPASTDLDAAVDRVAENGFKGLKLHPYYQDAALDSPEVIRLARRAAKRGLILLCHCGYDAAFPSDPVASPQRLRRLLDEVHGLTLVAAHLGGWKDWEASRDILVGLPIYLDTSFSLQYLSREAALDILSSHPRTHLLFGSDSPWGDQKESLSQLADFGRALGDEWLEAVAGGNARALLEAE